MSEQLNEQSRGSGNLDDASLVHADATSLPAFQARSGQATAKPACGTMTMSMALDHYVGHAVVDAKRLMMIARDVRRAFRLEPSLADLPANGHSVRFTLKKFGGAKSNQNMRSSIRAVLKFIHHDVPREQTSLALKGKWEALLASVDDSNYKKFRLLRFARYCQQRLIEPADVTDLVMADFYAWLIKIDTVKDTSRFQRDVITAWNTCFDLSNGPCLRLLLLPKHNAPPQLTPSLDDMHEDVANEIVKALEFMANDAAVKEKRKRFDKREASDGGQQPERKKLSESTCESYGKYIRRAVRILGDDPDRAGATVSLREITAPAAMEFIMNAMSDELLERGKGERSLHLMGCAILFLAKHYFVVSEADLVEIKRMYLQVTRPEPKMTVKNLKRLRSLVLQKRHELMRLPAKLLNGAVKAVKEGRKTPRLLVDAQVAVAVAILPTIPIREKNLAAIRLGEHLTIPERRGTTGRLSIPGTLVKNGVEIDRLVPVDVAEVLREYIKHVLPLLRADPSSNALFPGRHGDTTRGAACLGTMVSKRIKEHLGVDVNLHLFRHFVALMYLEEHPGEYEVVRILLGNRNLEIVKAFYAGAEHDAAVAKANTVVANVKFDAGLNPKNMLEVTGKPKRRGI